MGLESYFRSLLIAEASMENTGARKDGRSGLREQAGWRKEVMSCVSCHEHMLRKSKETSSHLPLLLFLCSLSPPLDCTYDGLVLAQ